MSATMTCSEKKLSNFACIWEVHGDRQRIKLAGSNTSLLYIITLVQYVITEENKLPISNYSF